MLAEYELNHLDELVTIRDWVRFAWTSMNEAPLYFGHGTDNAYDESMSLVLGSLKLPWNTPEYLLEAALTTLEKQTILSLLKERVVGRVPLPYLLGEAFFCGHSFLVNRDVLIPRSPIAELIQSDFRPWFEKDEASHILDMCTGSGCIGLACALANEGCQVDLVDISDQALAVASRNIDRYALQSRVSVIKSDLFESIGPKRQQYDIIVANPPYVADEEASLVPVEFSYEPSLALYSGEDGLDSVRQILAEASAYLSDDGLFVCEVGNAWEALERAYPKTPFTWVSFEHGGTGVFVMSRSELQQFEHP